MKKFKYKAKTLEGKTMAGLVEASSEKDAARVLQKRQMVVISLREKGISSFTSFFSVLQGISSKEVAEFTRQLATMISAGLPLTDSLTLLQEQSKPAMSKILADVVKEIEGGSSLYEALSKHPKAFPKIYLALVKSGETAGSLDEVLKNMSQTLEKQEEFKRKVKGAMIYPVIVITGMIGVILIMMIFVIPKLTAMYEEFGTELPMTTKVLMGFSSLLRNYWFVFFGGLAGAVIAFKNWQKTAYGRQKVDEIMLKIPILGVLKRKIILTEVTRTFAMLLSAGVSMMEALNIVAEAANNAIFENSIRKVAKDVEKGLPLTVSFERFEEYPPIFCQMISVGEETGKLDDLLIRLSKQFEMESEEAVKALTTALEPLMMVVLGIGVGFIVISIITPIYNLTSQF